LYKTDSLSKGYIIIDGTLTSPRFYKGSFEVDVVNVNNPQDRIKITNGHFYLGNGSKALYTFTP
jgi:hypothetical protein